MSGWAEAGLFVLCTSLLSVVYAVANAAGVHTVPFILYSLLLSAAALLLIAGLGPDPRRVMVAPLSWVVGAANLATEATFYLSINTVSPADASLLVRLSIPLSLVLGLPLLGRRPDAWTATGGLIVVLGIGLVTAQLDPARQAAGVVFAALCALAVNVRAFASEVHPWNRAAQTVLDKMRVTGLIILATATVIVVFVGALMLAIGCGALPATPLVPELGDLAHIPTVLLSVLVGAGLFTAMNYLAFSSVVKIRTENFIAISAFTPLWALVLQHVAAALGLMTLPPFDWRSLPAIAIVIAGVFVLIWRARRSI